MSAEPDEDVVLDTKGSVCCFLESDPHASDLTFNTSIAALNSTQRSTRGSWCRFQLCLVVSSNLDCLRQSTRGRISLGSQTDLLESQEIHECRNRLHNVVCWSFVATLHEGGTGGTMQEVQYCQDVCVTATVQEEIVQLSTSVPLLEE